MAHPLTIAPLLVLLAASGGVPVAVGNFDISTLPNLAKVERTLPHADMTKRVDDMLASKQCTIKGQYKGRFDIVVPYAIQMDSSGTATKVVVSDLGCQPLSMLVAKIVVAQAARGDFKPKPGVPTEWYSSDVYFRMGEQKIGEALADPNKVRCKSTPVLGSRLKVNRVCKTAAEWALHEKDMDQLGRDIRNSGACAGNPSCAQ
jgi:hypothetical protein